MALVQIKQAFRCFGLLKLNSQLLIPKSGHPNV